MREAAYPACRRMKKLLEVCEMGSKLSIGLIVSLAGVLFAGAVRPAHAAPPADPCSLLTQAQVSAVLGVDAGAGKHMATTICQWAGPGPAGKNSKTVLLTLQDARVFPYAKAEVGHGIVKTAVTGIGDDAVYGTTPGLATVLTVKKGDVVFVVHVTGFPDEELKAKEKTLALQVLPKL